MKCKINHLITFDNKNECKSRRKKNNVKYNKGKFSFFTVVMNFKILITQKGAKMGSQDFFFELSR